MNKTMKSYRLSEDAIYDLKAIAANLDMTETAALELAIDWAYKSGIVYALENVRNRDGKISVRRTIDEATRDGEITCTVRAKTWTAGNRTI